MNRSIKAKKILVAILAVLVLLSGSYIGYRVVSEIQRRKKIVALFSAQSGYDGKLDVRYIAYYDSNSDVDVAELLELVNSDIDLLETP